MKAASGALAQSPQLKKCTGCGNCLSVCPSFKTGSVEPFSPRGRLALGIGVAQRAIQPEAVFKSFQACLHCGKCQQACPLELPLQSFFLAVSASIARYYKLPASVKLLERLLLLYPAIPAFLQPPLALGSSLSQKLPARFRFTADLPVEPFNPPKPEERKDTGQSAAILLFPGCIARHLLPEIAAGALEWLTACGFEAAAPRNLGCCGRPALMRGASILKGIRRNLEILAKLKFKRLVTPCPGCLATIRHVWPRVPGLTAKEKAQAETLADCAEDLSNFILGQNRVQFKNAHTAVFWHKPCLLPKKTEGKIRHTLAEIYPAVFSGARNDCCGAPLKCAEADRENPGEYTGRRQARDVIAQALAMDAGQLVTACPGCMAALQKELARINKSLPVRHAVSIFYENMEKKEKPAAW